MKVEYIEHMGSDRSVLNAARASFNKSQPQDAPITDRDKSLLLFLARGFQEDEWTALARKLAHEGSLGNIEKVKDLMWGLRNKPVHFAPFAHPQISVRVTAPLAIARQLWKAHIGAVGGDVGYAAWSEESRRYVDEDPDFYLPGAWYQRADNVKQGRSSKFAVLPAILDRRINDLLTEAASVYRTLVGGFNVAPEQARFMLPPAAMTTWVWTGSLVFFARVCHQRIDTHTPSRKLPLLPNRSARSSPRCFLTVGKLCAMALSPRRLNE